jgi:hypothetical protein
MKIPKDYEELAHAATDQGWTIKTTHGGHLAWINPFGKKVFSPSSPGDRKRGRLNVRRKLREHGLKI